MWMRGDAMTAGSPPMSPPVVWTYHPIMYPPSTPPATTGNIMVCLGTKFPCVLNFVCVNVRAI
jgi:hypothetical protein